MASQKHLSSIAHNIAHHAVSGLSYVHPHLRQALRKVGQTSVVIDLLSAELCQTQSQSSKPLNLALGALKEKFEQIVSSEGLSLSEIRSAHLLFDLPATYRDDHCSDCHAYLVSTSGKTYRQAVNYLGLTIAPNASLNPTQPRTAGSG